MSEQLLQDTHRYAQADGQRGHAVPEAVQVDRAHARCGDVRSQGAIERLRHDRRAIRRADVYGRHARQDCGSLMQDHLPVQQRDEAGRDRDIPTARSRLGRSVDQTPADTLTLIADVDQACGMIDVNPAQPGQLPAPEAAA